MTNFIKTPDTADRITSPEIYKLATITNSLPYLVFERDSMASVRHVHMRGNCPGTYGNTAVSDAKSNWPKTKYGEHDGNKNSCAAHRKLKTARDELKSFTESKFKKDDPYKIGVKLQIAERKADIEVDKLRKEFAIV
ncbi:MAG: hypothetical protein COA84_13510 [Robiginitomaculum sp.]|nr:MAG: hypothetical protein COA84_13510 [Robiginitomaculum sp.]